jgi:hypothetical protein
VREFPIAISLKKRVYVQVEKICKRLFSTWCLGPSYDQILATPLTVGEFPIAISLKKRVYVQAEKQEGLQDEAMPLNVGEFPTTISLKK